MGLLKGDTKKIIQTWAETMMDMGRLFAILGFAVKKAEEEGLLDKLDDIKLFQIGEGKVLEITSGVCAHDVEGNKKWTDLGHGFSKCDACGAIKQGGK